MTRPTSSFEGLVTRPRNDNHRSQMEMILLKIENAYSESFSGNLSFELYPEDPFSIHVSTRITQCMKDYTLRYLGISVEAFGCSSDGIIPSVEKLIYSARRGDESMTCRTEYPVCLGRKPYLPVFCAGLQQRWVLINFCALMNTGPRVAC